MVTSGPLEAPAIELQESPLIYCTVLPGFWLLKHATPSWRIEDPELGFQRVVKEARAVEIANAVLAQGRTFPNSLVLATNKRTFETQRHNIEIPHATRFLVVDGQHRLWAQHFTEHEAKYSCVVHMGLDEVQMARLFLEINDTQKRVPASLRWDLVRLVRPDDDAAGIRAAEIVYQLATDERSPLYQRIDLTGEQGQIRLKQASVAPEIKSVVSSTKWGLRSLDFEGQCDVLIRYVNAIKSCDPDGWARGDSPLYGARVFRVLIRLLPLILIAVGKTADAVRVTDYLEYLRRIDLGTLDGEEIRAAQGSAGMKEIQKTIQDQVFP